MFTQTKSQEKTSFKNFHFSNIILLLENAGIVLDFAGKKEF